MINMILIECNRGVAEAAAGRDCATTSLAVQPAIATTAGHGNCLTARRFLKGCLHFLPRASDHPLAVSRRQPLRQVAARDRPLPAPLQPPAFLGSCHAENQPGRPTPWAGPTAGWLARARSPAEGCGVAAMQPAPVPESAGPESVVCPPPWRHHLEAVLAAGNCPPH